MDKRFIIQNYFTEKVILFLIFAFFFFQKNIDLNMAIKKILLVFQRDVIIFH